MHALEPHSHGGHAEEPAHPPRACETLSEIVVHGHSHEGESTDPDHDHALLPAPPWRHEPREHAAALAVATAPGPVAPGPAASRLRFLAPPDPASAGPPSLYRLCTLLI